MKQNNTFGTKQIHFKQKQKNKKQKNGGKKKEKRKNAHNTEHLTRPTVCFTWANQQSTIHCVTLTHTYSDFFTFF